MKANKFILFLLLASYITASAQVMNVRKWRKSEKDSLDNGMYFIEEENYLRALPIFDALVNNHPKEEFLRYTYAKCALYRADKHEDAYTILTELYEKNKKVPEIQYDVALSALYNYKFDKATEYVDFYAINKHTNDAGKANAVALKKNITEENAALEMLHEIPAGRFAEPQEPAFAAAFLCSNYAAYINGINLPVDGGRTGSL